MISIERHQRDIEAIAEIQSALLQIEPSTDTLRREIADWLQHLALQRMLSEQAIQEATNPTLTLDWVSRIKVFQSDLGVFGEVA